MTPESAAVSDLITLVRRFGSPLYLYQLNAVERAHADLRSVLPHSARLYYSLKANPHPDVARALGEAGCRAEISSSGELDAALHAGFAAVDCLYTGPGQTPAEIDYALAGGVRHFSVESATALRRLGHAALAHRTEAQVLLRVNGASAGTTGLRMTGAATQFGIDERLLLADPALFTRVKGTRLVGLHLFPVSNARDEDALIQAFRASARLARRIHELTGLPLDVVDLGGGFATPYAQPGIRPRYPRLREALHAILDAEIPAWRSGAIQIAFESGRYLVGDSGQLAATVLDVKHSHDQTFLVLDTGIHHLGGMTGLGRLARPQATPLAGYTATTATLVGPLCTPADVLGRSVTVPDVSAGDLLVFPHVGAYSLTASLVAFLGRPSPAEVVLRGKHTVSATRLQLAHAPLNLPPEQP